MTEAQTTADTELDNVRHKTGDLVEELVRLVDQSRDMVAVTARNTISTGYAQYARRHGAAATAWSIAGSSRLRV